jgi:hypothetical protein
MCRSARCGILRKADMYRSRQLSQRCGARSKLLGSSLSTRKKKPWASGCREMPTQVSGASRILPTQGTAPVPRDEFHPDTPGEDKGASKHHPRPPNLEASLASERKLSYSGTGWGSRKAVHSVPSNNGWEAYHSPLGTDQIDGPWCPTTSGRFDSVGSMAAPYRFPETGARDRNRTRWQDISQTGIGAFSVLYHTRERISGDRE